MLPVVASVTINLLYASTHKVMLYALEILLLCTYAIMLLHIVEKGLYTKKFGLRFFYMKYLGF